MRFGTKDDLTRILSGSRNMAFDKEGEERDVDKVAALGMAQTFEHHMRMVDNLRHANRDSYLVGLGVSIMAFKQGLQAKEHVNLMDKLSAELDLHLRYIKSDFVRYWTARAIARQAIQEVTIDMCSVCQGKTEVPNHDRKKMRGKQPMKICTECSGTGRGGAYSIFDRAREMFCKPSDPIVRDKVDYAVNLLKEAEFKATINFHETRGSVLIL